MLLRHNDYFEWNLLKKQTVQEGHWPTSVPLKTGNKFSMWRAPSLYLKGKRHLYYQRQGIQGLESHITKLVPSSLICYPKSKIFLSILHKCIVYCLNVKKADCFGLFLESHIFINSWMYQIKFFSLF